MSTVVFSYRGLCFIEVDGDHRDLHVLTHSFPTRRSSDLLRPLRYVAQLRIRLVLGCSIIPARLCVLLVAAEPGDGIDGIRNTAATAKQMKGSAERRSEEHTSELQSLMRISYAVFGLKKKKQT